MEYHLHETMKTNRLVMTVLWPAFLMAAVSCGILFSLIDPLDLVIFGERVSLAPQAIYTLGFLLFWGLGCVSSIITLMLVVKPR